MRPGTKGLGDGDGYYYGDGHRVYCQEVVKAVALGPVKERLVMLMLLACENVGITLELPSPYRMEGLQRLSLAKHGAYQLAPSRQKPCLKLRQPATGGRCRIQPLLEYDHRS